MGRGLSYSNVASTLALVVALAGGAYAATGGSLIGADGTISACVPKKGGAISVIRSGRACPPGKAAIHWNVQGVPGRSGIQGTPGVPGAQGPAGAGGAPGAGGSTGAPGQPGDAGATGIGINGLFGSGVDGSVTLAANTTLSRDEYYNNLTVNPGVTLNPGGYRIFVAGTLTLGAGASIARNGTDASTTGLTAGTLGGSGGGGPNNGGNGTTETNALGGGGGGSGSGVYSGGAATPPSTVNGGAQVLDSALSAVTGRTLAGTPVAGGGGGAGDQPTNGQATGGAGGGVIVVVARTVAVNGSASITANGGASSNGGGAGGGGGGGGGVVVVISTVPRPSTLTLSAAGGVAGALGVGANGSPGMTEWLS